MKTVIHTAIALLALLIVIPTGSQAAESAEGMFTHCTWNSWFKYPKHNGHYPHGQDIYVRVDPQKYHDIAYMELFVDGHYIRRESHYPYEWAKGNGTSDHKLRNLSPGKHYLKVKIKDRCGYVHYKTIWIYIDGNGGGGHNGHCEWKSWFKYPKNNGSYQAGNDVYVRVDPQKYQDILWMEMYINGKYIRKETKYPYEWAKGSGNSDHYLRNMKAGTYKLKCRIKTKCGKYYEIYCTFYVKGQGGGGNTHCDNNGWFKYPYNGAYHSYGSDVYVRVDVSKKHHISYIELYVNGKFVRKEFNYPYEWAKGNGNSDYYLRNMKKGTYKLKARIFDKCGHYKDIYRTFYVN